MPKNVPPRFILAFWPVADRLLRAIQHIRPLRADDSGIIRYSIRCYKGTTRLLNDGSEVRTGDTIIELHLNNAWFERRRRLHLSASQSPQVFLGCFAKDLHLLAEQIANGVFGNIAALHGITLLDAAARRLGFQIDELPDGLWKRGARFYMAGLMRVYHLRGDEVSELKEKTWEPKAVWFSRTALLTRYGPKNP